MKLTLVDRITIQRILPAEGDILTLRTVKKLVEKLDFNDKEKEEYGLKADTVKNADGKPVRDNRGNTITQITWKADAVDKTADVKIIREERQLILDTFEKISNDKKMNQAYLEVYDKIKKFHDEIEKKG